MLKKIVLLPAFNEQASVESLVRKIADVARDNGWDYLILACDDGSTDCTGLIFEKLQQSVPMEILTHRINRGLGETVRDLFERAAEIATDDDAIIRLDCDDSHEPEHMADLIAKLDEGYDVVTASRFQPGGSQLGVTPMRAFISASANMFLRVMLRFPNVKEYSCGYRAYRGEIVRQALATYGNNFIQLKGLGFTCTIEKLIKFHMLGARFAEVPFVLHYDQKLSVSKMVTNTTTLGYLTLLLLYRWPWGGWRSAYMRKSGQGKAQHIPNKAAPTANSSSG